MKNFILMTATAAFVLVPTLAHADYDKSRDSHLKSYNRADMSDRTDNSRRDAGADYVVHVDTTESANVKKNKAYSFTTANGERIQVKGESIYLTTAQGRKYFAPNGQYTAPSGITYVAQDGIVLRTEAPDQTAYVYTDEGLNVEIKDHR